MNKVTLKVSLYFAAAFALSAVSGFAQQAEHVSVKVPFEFTAGSSILPPGDYDFHEQENGVMLISSPANHKSIVVLTNPEASMREYSPSSVKFEKNGEHYSLSEVDLNGQPARKLLRFDRDTSPASLSSKVGVTNAAVMWLKKQ